MDLSHASFLRCVDLVYAAAEDPRHWRDVYTGICTAVGAKSVHMLGVDKRHRTLAYSDGANLPVEGELAYMHHYRLLDPRRPIAASAGEGGWSHFPEMLDPELAQSHALYRDFLVPYDRRYNSECNLVDTPEATVILSVLTGEAEGPLPTDAREFLERLKPHLQRACRMGIRTFVYSSQALVGHLLVSRLRQPVFLMTSGGDIIHCNDAARDLLRSTHLVRVNEGRLELPPPYLAELLRRCLELENGMKMEAAGGGDPIVRSSHFRSLRVMHREDCLYAFFAMLSPQREMGAFGQRPVVMLLLYHPSSAPTVDASLLYATFGLTPAECRIAIQLADGLSLKEIAAAHGTQHDTVRKHLQSIYRKTSTNRQPELVRLLLHLPRNVQDLDVELAG